MREGLMIGWTTLETREDAERLGREAVEQGLVACAQVDAPILSVYRWEGRVETGEEHRLTLKFLASKAGEVEVWLLRNHPYETPQWTVVECTRVSEGYLAWSSGGAGKS